MTDKPNNVVDLTTRRDPTPGAADASVAELPAGMAALREKCQLFLAERLTSLLDDVDDTLFELADEASSAKEQHLYFDSMREIRVHRQVIEQKFSTKLRDNFTDQLNAAVNGAADRGRAKLKLLESDALEELVAIEGMAKKAERQHLQQLWQLSVAWQHSVGGESISAAELPMGPAKIAKAFSEACRDLNIDIKARLILFKMFDSQIISRYGELFDLMLPVLETSGVALESEQPEPRQREDESSAATESSGAVDEGNSRPAAELVNQLVDAMDEVFQQASANESATLSKPSFMVALQDMQDEQFSHLKTRGAANDSHAFLEISQKLVSRLREVSRVSQNDASALSLERDQDTVHFVGTLFQYMLEGDGLSDPLKRLLAHLQIPILKMAMLDKSFFSREEHPARKLLSAIVGAGIGWSPVSTPEKDPLYKKLEEVVMRILGDFGVDTQVFVDVLTEFGKFQEKAQRRAELVAQRTINAEGGRATAQAARSYISGLLEDKLSEADYPPVARKVLLDGWSKVLFLSYVQSGPESASFKDEVQFVERFLWSVAPNNEAEHRNELITALPVLIETLRLGFNRVSLNAFETGKWFEQLERLHLAKLSRNEAPSAPRAADEEQALEDLDAALAELDEPAVVSTENVTADEAVEPELGSNESPIDDAASTAAALEALRVGNWVDLRQDDGKMLRCRLAAVINGIGKYIFVNRAGIKVAEYDMDTLRSAVVDGDIVLIEDDRMFDRALESVISNLRDMHDKPLS